MNVLQYLWSTSPRSALKSTKAKIAQHIEEFEIEVKLLDRKTVRRQNVEMIRSLNAPLATLEEKAKPIDYDKMQFPIWVVNMYRNYTFTGREADLKKMSDFLLPKQEHRNQPQDDTTTASEEPRCCILHGIGGVGKTQTALEYCYLHRKAYDAVFWLPAERDIELRDAFATIAKRLGIVSEGKKNEDQPREGIRETRTWLETTGETSLHSPDTSANSNRA